mmetsp:Transcript_7225/g.25819  ORF Transcript_7225/g.25819 Transcript_7225/m.25819 type:complete len:556 (+) Transcript_7225:758-2425(+)
MQRRGRLLRRLHHGHPGAHVARQDLLARPAHPVDAVCGSAGRVADAGAARPHGHPAGAGVPVRHGDGRRHLQAARRQDRGLRAGESAALLHGRRLQLRHPHLLRALPLQLPALHVAGAAGRAVGGFLRQFLARHLRRGRLHGPQELPRHVHRRRARVRRAGPRLPVHGSERARHGVRERLRGRRHPARHVGRPRGADDAADAGVVVVGQHRHPLRRPGGRDHAPVPQHRRGVRLLQACRGVQAGSGAARAHRAAQGVGRRPPRLLRAMRHRGDAVLRHGVVGRRHRHRLRHPAQRHMHPVHGRDGHDADRRRRQDVAAALRRPHPARAHPQPDGGQHRGERRDAVNRRHAVLQDRPPAARVSQGAVLGVRRRLPHGRRRLHHGLVPLQRPHPAMRPEPAELRVVRLPCAGGAHLVQGCAGVEHGRVGAADARAAVRSRRPRLRHAVGLPQPIPAARQEEVVPVVHRHLARPAARPLPAPRHAHGLPARHRAEAALPGEARGDGGAHRERHDRGRGPRGHRAGRVRPAQRAAGWHHHGGLLRLPVLMLDTHTHALS